MPCTNLVHHLLLEKQLYGSLDLLIGIDRSKEGNRRRPFSTHTQVAELQDRHFIFSLTPDVGLVIGRSRKEKGDGYYISMLWVVFCLFFGHIVLHLIKKEKRKRKTSGITRKRSFRVAGSRLYVGFGGLFSRFQPIVTAVYSVHSGLSVSCVLCCLLVYFPFRLLEHIFIRCC